MTRRIMVAAVATLCAAAWCRAYEDGDSQLWVNLGVNGKIYQELGFKFEEETRFGDDMSENYEQQLFGIADYRILKWLQAGLGYREVFSRVDQQIYTAKGSGEEATYTPVPGGGHYWKRENRPTADLLFRTGLLGCPVDDRVRIEYRMKQGEDEYFRYRNLIRVKSPWKWTPVEIGPYVSWEAFYSDKDVSPAWDRFRYAAGVDSKLTERLKGILYYMLQQDKKTDDWQDTNVVGLALALGI